MLSTYFFVQSTNVNVYTHYYTILGYLAQHNMVKCSAIWSITLDIYIDFHCILNSEGQPRR